jgi:hypothetical protein
MEAETAVYKLDVKKPTIHKISPNKKPTEVNRNEP